MKKLIQKTLFLFLLISTIGKAQDNHIGCGTGLPTSEEIQQTQAFIKNYQKNTKNLRPSAETVYIPLKINVITKDDGVTSFNLRNLNTAIAHANYLFRKANIQFFITGAINYIKNSQSYDFQSLGIQTEDALCKPYDVTNAINVYVFNSLKNQNESGFLGGYTFVPTTAIVQNNSYNRIMITGSGLQGYNNIGNKSFSHELGHYLGLYHTFETRNGTELVTRGAGSNCETAGDLVCDTPADPYSSIPAASADRTLCGTANFTGVYKDANGDTYKPDLKNLMTYYGQDCRLGFTDGQIQRILAGLALRKTSTVYNFTATDTQVTPPTITSAIVNDGGVIDINFKDNSANETGFIIERATVKDGEYISVGGETEKNLIFSDEMIDIVPTNDLTYYYRIKASNTKSGFSNVFEVKTKAKNYCIPSTRDKCWDVKRLFFRSLQVNKGTFAKSFSYTSCSSNSNYTYTIDKGFELETNSKYDVTTGIEAPDALYYNIIGWLDINKNGIFEESERVLATKYTSTNIPKYALIYKDIFSISTTNLSGDYTLRLRVFLADNLSESCAGAAVGDAKDYAIKVLGAYSVQAGTIATPSICPNTAITVPFTNNGTPSADNKYTLQLSDAQGNNFKDLATTLDGTNLKATIPANTVAGTAYKVRIVSSSPVSQSISASTLTIKPLPTADFATKTATTQLGQSVDVKFTLTGEAPFKIKLSDSKIYDLAEANASIKLSPTETTDYKITSVSNVCGEGTFASTILKVSYLASLQTNDIANAAICKGGELIIPFTLDGKVDATNKYTAQLSDNQGANFKDISSVIDGTSIKATIPKDTKEGTGYKVRVNASSPVLVGAVSKSTITIKPLPTAKFADKETTIQQYSSADVKLNLTGDVPQKVKISDGQNFDFNDLNPTIKLTPNQTTEYKLTSVNNVCGEGTVATDVFKITVTAVLGFEPNIEGIEVFPNPTEQSIILSLGKVATIKTNAELIDNQGKTFFQQEIKEEKTSISLQAIPAGTYFLRVLQGEKVLVKKIIKN